MTQLSKAPKGEPLAKADMKFTALVVK